MKNDSRPMAAAEGARPDFATLDFDRSPFTVAWEVTRACALACVHCRAEAQPRRHPRELSTGEAFDVIEQIVEIGKPILVVTGGDPLMRPDVFEILERAASRGLRVALSPSATGRCTREALRRARDCGISRIHISVDGPDAPSHDAFRGVAGSFARTEEILADIRDLGIPLQIGTTVSRFSVGRLREINDLVAQSGALMWSLFFLVPTGRGQATDMISPKEHEEVFRWMAEIGETSPFDVRSTAGMHFRRVLIQQRQAGAGAAAGRGGVAVTGAGFSSGPMGMSPRGVNDGDGFAFIDHLGAVCPSGFLQVPAGNVREHSLADIYRTGVIFKDLRDRSLLHGKCGVCDYRAICGGSRARAYSMTGDYLASDPSCNYIPPAWSTEC